MPRSLLDHPTTGGLLTVPEVRARVVVVVVVVVVTAVRADGHEKKKLQKRQQIERQATLPPA